MLKIDYCDQSGARPPIAAGVLHWPDDVAITARLLIAERVRSEFEARAERFDAHGEQLPAALVTPRTEDRSISPEEAVEIALRAFSTNRLFLLVDGRQIVDLNAPFPLTPKSAVVFVRLTRLVGG